MTKALLAQALALSDDPVIRGRVAAQSQDGTASVALFGANRRGKSSVIFYVDMGVGIGGSAQSVGDGQDAYGATAQLGCGLPDVESHESDDPVLWLWREIVPNCGGPGVNRGGQGISQGFVLYGSDGLGGPGFNACAEVPPRGFSGGYPGAAGRHYVIRESNVRDMLGAGIQPLRSRISGRADEPPSKVGHLVLGPDDVQIWQGGGGGGLGDPLLRAPELVLRDVVAGYVTTEHALHAYGVVTCGDALDVEETSRVRRERRIARLGAAPTRYVRERRDVGVAIIASPIGRGWICGYCQAELGTTPWSGSTTVEARAPLVAHFAELAMYVRARVEPPSLDIAIRYCAACGSALYLDIVAAGREPRPPLPVIAAAS
jgi:N-methylhydantoinase B